MKNLITMMLTMAVLLFCVACDDKDNDKTQAPDEAVCAPACGDNQECKCAEVEGKNECKCEDKAPAATEVCNPECGEGKVCKCGEPAEDGKVECACEDAPAEECRCDNGDVCPEGGKDACPAVETKEPDENGCYLICKEGFTCKCEEIEGKNTCKCVVAEEPEPQAACDPACNEDKECKCVENACECVPKEESKPEDPKCDPACAENQECACADDKCECKDKNAEEPKACDPACADNQECKDGACVDKPTEEKPEE